MVVGSQHMSFGLKMNGGDYMVYLILIAIILIVIFILNIMGIKKIVKGESEMFIRILTLLLWVIAMVLALIY